MVARTLSSSLNGINNKIYLRRLAKMQEQNKKPPEYYKNEIKYLDLWIKRNFSDKGREIGCEYESCFVTITKEQLKSLVNAIGDKEELMLTGKGWLNDISDPNSSKLHVELLSHSQSNVDYIEQYNQRKQNSNYQKPNQSTPSQYLEAKNTPSDTYVTETDYRAKASQVKTTTDMDDDIPF
jgi:hypothetical protein|tara:strand:+ start:433 stop:975 length:543 start_codon:yes stop_codon:yes gene_type:complete